MVNENTRSVPPWYRRQILREQNGKCANTTCSKQHDLNWKECETNHIIPWCKGGRTVRWNLEVLCITCHKNNTRSQAKQRVKKVPVKKKKITTNLYKKQYNQPIMRLRNGKRVRNGI
jgi:5-methylcytosine-specific restriction endonuclease McrA